MQDALAKKSSSEIENFQSSFELELKRYSEIAYRLDEIGNKLLDDRSPEVGKVATAETQARRDGHLSKFKDLLDHFSTINTRMEGIMIKLDKII